MIFPFISFIQFTSFVFLFEQIVTFSYFKKKCPLPPLKSPPSGDISDTVWVCGRMAFLMLQSNDGRQKMATLGKIFWHRGQINVGTNVQDEGHSDDSVELKVTMEEPVAGIVGLEADHDVAVVWHSNGILEWGALEVTLDEAFSVQFEHVFEVDFLDGTVGGTANADYVVCVAVQVKGVTEVDLLH